MRHALGPLIFACILATGCDDGGVVVDPDAMPSPVGQGTAATADLVVNEIYPRGDGPDWIELYNRGSQAIDLCGYFVTDSLDRLDHYLPLGGVMPPAVCEPQMLPAGAYLVVYADDNAGDNTDPTGEHAPFKLGIADETHVVTIEGEPVDSLVYLHPPEGVGMSLSRAPNGEGLFFLAEPSEGEQNVEASL